MKRVVSWLLAGSVALAFCVGCGDKHATPTKTMEAPKQPASEAPKGEIKVPK